MMGLANTSRTPLTSAAVFLLTLLVSGQLYADTTLLLRGELVSQDADTSFQQQGISHQRFDDNELQLSQAILSTRLQLNSDWKLHGVLKFKK